jgi:hypothetical protein
MVKVNKRKWPRFSVAMQKDLRDQYKKVCFLEGITMEADVTRFIERRVQQAQKGA